MLWSLFEEWCITLAFFPSIFFSFSEFRILLVSLFYRAYNAFDWSVFDSDGQYGCIAIDGSFSKCFKMMSNIKLPHLFNLLLYSLNIRWKSDFRMNGNICINRLRSIKKQSKYFIEITWNLCHCVWESLLHLQCTTFSISTNVNLKT